MWWPDTQSSARTSLSGLWPGSGWACWHCPGDRQSPAGQGPRCWLWTATPGCSRTARCPRSCGWTSGRWWSALTAQHRQLSPGSQCASTRIVTSRLTVAKARQAATFMPSPSDASRPHAGLQRLEPPKLTHAHRTCGFTVCVEGLPHAGHPLRQFKVQHAAAGLTQCSAAALAMWRAEAATLPALQPCRRLCMPAAGALQHLEASDVLMYRTLCLMWVAIIHVHAFAQIKTRTTIACRRSNEVLAALSSQDSDLLADRCSRNAGNRFRESPGLDLLSRVWTTPADIEWPFYMSAGVKG